MPVFASKTVDNKLYLVESEAFPVDNFGVLAWNLGLMLLITAYFLWVTLLVLGAKLIQTCGKVG